jgi:hypothetical protein
MFDAPQEAVPYGSVMLTLLKVRDELVALTSPSLSGIECNGDITPTVQRQ